MSGNLSAIVDNIINKAEQKVKADIKSISAMAKTDFVNKANEVVLMYYANYEPRLYIRTYNLQGGVVDENVSFSMLNGDGAWIQFSSSGMAEYSDGGDKSIVVSSFMSGIHGRPSVQVDSPSPMELMDEFQIGYKKTLDGYFSALGYNVN